MTQENCPVCGRLMLDLTDVGSGMVVEMCRPDARCPKTIIILPSFEPRAAQPDPAIQNLCLRAAEVLLLDEQDQLDGFDAGHLGNAIQLVAGKPWTELVE